MENKWHRCDIEYPKEPGNYWIYFEYRDLVTTLRWNGKEWSQRGWLSITHWAESQEKPTEKPDMSEVIEVGMNIGVFSIIPSKWQQETAQKD